MHTDLAGVQRQLSLELAAKEAGGERLTTRTRKREEQGRGSQTTYGSKAISLAVDTMSTEVRRTIGNLTRGPAGRGYATLAKMLADMDPKVLSVITMKVCLDTLVKTSQGRTTNHTKDPSEYKTVIIAIGQAVQAERRLSHYLSEAPGLYKAIEKRWHSSKGNKYRITDMTRAMNKEGIEWEAWSAHELARVGTFLLSIFIKETGWAEFDVIQRAKRDKVTHVRLSRDFIEMRDTVMARAIELAYMQWPMLCPPVDWSATEKGGYLTAEARSRTLVRGYSFAQRPDQGDLPIKMLNNLQRVAYRINRNVYDVAKLAYQDWRVIGSFRRARAVEAHNWLTEDATKEQIREWRTYRTKVENENARNDQHNWRTTEVMFTAGMFANEEKFYLPWNFDYRGRVYTLPTSLSPQGTDFDKSLFYFAEEGPINEYWLLWQAGTAFGLDKKTHDERVQWARDNFELFTIIAQDPYGTARMWDQASEPWVFLAAVLEIYDCLIAQTKDTSGLPIGIDATCSGLQHLSALTLNRSAAVQVNVVPTPEPSDGYRTVANAALKYLPEEIHSWIDRKVTKRTVMTLCYGVTRHSARGYIHSALVEKGKDPKPYITEITDAIYNKAVTEVFPGPIVVMGWLKRVAREIVNRGVDSIEWRTPSGFVVNQFRNKLETERVQTRIMGSVKSFSMASGPGTPDPGKHAASLPPNLVHSLDASLLHFMFSEWDRPFTCIHDCILGRSCDMDDMQRDIRMHFVEMYKGEPLKDWASQLDLTIPPSIIRGDLDLDQVNDSHYFFC